MTWVKYLVLSFYSFLLIGILYFYYNLKNDIDLNII